MLPENETQVYELQRPSGQGPLKVQVSRFGLHLPGGEMLPWRTLGMVNLSHVPASRYNQEHYLCRIYAAEAMIAVCAPVGAGAEQATYRAFLLDLHARITYAEAKPQFTLGMRSRVGYVFLISSVAAAFVLLEGLVAYAITQRGKLGLGIGFMAGVALVGFLFLRMAVRVLQPRRYNPANLPEEVLPV
jgi:hypothetical protein